MRTYIYILRLVPRYHNPEAWTDKENKTVQDHADRLQRQQERGLVKYVGKTDLPITDPENFGLVVFEAENDTMAELFMGSDPAVMRGMMTAKCLPFKRVF